MTLPGSDSTSAAMTDWIESITTRLAPLARIGLDDRVGVGFAQEEQVGCGEAHAPRAQPDLAD